MLSPSPGAPGAAASGAAAEAVAPRPAPPPHPGRPPQILHVFPSFSIGGVQLRIADVANRLGPAFRHRAVALDGRTDAAARLAPATDWAFQDGPAPSGLRAFGAIRRAIARSAADLLCTYNFGAMDWVLANALGPRLAQLHFESGFGPEEAQRPLRRRSLYRRLALRGVRRLVVPSHGLVEIARQHRWIAPDRVVLVPNGVDLTWYDPDLGLPPLPDLAPGPVRVVAVAPLRPEKRLDRLIALFAQAATQGDAELVICGDGPCAAALRAQAAASDVAGRIRFAGHVGDVRRVLQGDGVFALTSETEQMPNALIQAMAMRRAVVAFDAGDVARILPDVQRPHVHAQHDGAGFAASLRRLLADPARRQRLGTANRRRAAERYDLASMVEIYRGLYTDALERAR